MTDSFYRSHSSTFFYGKRGKITSDFYKIKKLIFRQDEFVTLIGKAVIQTENGLRLGLEVLSENLINDIIPYNFIEIIENRGKLFISKSDFVQKQSEILNSFLASNNVNDFGQYKELIKRNYILIQNLEQYIIVTPTTTIEELSPNNTIKNLLNRMGYKGNSSLEEISKINLNKYKNVGLGVKNKQILEAYLKLAGLTFNKVEKVRKKKAKRYPNN
jgi:hypothetical protein